MLFPNGEVIVGDMVDYIDLFFREEKRSRLNFDGLPSDYKFIAMVSPDLRVTVVNIFFQKMFSGAGVSVRCREDKYVKEAGMRLAISRALASIGLKEDYP